jgi:hypothetical protein
LLVGTGEALQGDSHKHTKNAKLTKFQEKIEENSLDGGFSRTFSRPSKNCTVQTRYAMNMAKHRNELFGIIYLRAFIIRSKDK